MSARILITGGAGFIGANLADRLARDGHQVVVHDALSRPGVSDTLAWLQASHPERIDVAAAEIRDADRLAACVADVDAVFHLAAQVAVTTRLEAPATDFAVNLDGTLNLPEAPRRRGGRVPRVFASTTKVYGNLHDLDLTPAGDTDLPSDPFARLWGIGEDRPLDFHTPYGCSKGGADQYVLDDARSFGIPSMVLQMSCINGPRQMGTEDQGWVAHFLISALEGRPISIYGDGWQVRDILHVADAVEAYLAAWARVDRVGGRAFNLGGGPANAVSLRQVVACIETLAGRPVDLHFADWRAGDQRSYVSDTRRATAARPRRLGERSRAALRSAGGRGLPFLRRHVVGSPGARPASPRPRLARRPCRGGLPPGGRADRPEAAFAAATARADGLTRAPSVGHNGRRPAPASRAAGDPAPFALTAWRLWDRAKNLATLAAAAAPTALPVRAAGPVAGPNGDRVARPHLDRLGTLDAESLAAQVARCPIFVSPARYEPFGLAVLEAAQAGCALVLSDIPTFRELRDGAAPFVAPQDARGIAETFDALAADTGRRANSGAAARVRADGYGVAAMVAGTRRTFDALSAARRRPHARDGEAA